MISPLPFAVPAGTIVMFSALTCPFAHIAVHRIFEARTRLGLDEQLRIDHHVFPIELVNSSPGTRHGSDSEVPVLGALEPEAGWQLWQGADYHYPNTVLLAFEAVQAAKAQSLRASELLDRALRRAFWAESQPIHLHHALVQIASMVPGLDAGRLEDALQHGTYRKAIFDDLAIIRSGAVKLSPHLFLSDGSDCANPGLSVRWQGDWAKGFPVVDADDPSVYAGLVARAVGRSG